MTPLRLSHSWYRRIYIAVALISLSYVVIYTTQLFGLIDAEHALQISALTASFAALTGVAAITLSIITKKISSVIPALAIYLALVITTALAVIGSGGVTSFYGFLWAITVFVAPLFGAFGWLTIVVLVGSYVAGAYLESALAADVVVALVASTVVPLAAGVALWREPPKNEDASTKNVKTLTSQLSEVAAKSEIVINAIGDGVIAVDGKGVIELINPAAQEILGWGKQDALMLSYASVLNLSDENNAPLSPAQDPIQQVLNTNQQARGNKIIAVTHSGKKLSISLVASPIGEPGSGAIAVFRDVTNERAEEREQAEFISTASHEMRTPVASIEGYLGLALNQNTATIDQRARDFILKAHESAEHLGRLFQDLLDVSKSEDGRMQNVPKVVDIVPFAETIVQGLSQKAADKGLSITFVPTATAGSQRKIMPVYYINLDNDHIREVLDNLIENAIKYTPQGEVRVDITGTEDSVIISIKDTGLGIPPEDIPHLFQKFYRVDNADRQAIGGTGLGLYLCRRLIEAMQGRLWVESTFGSGSTFFIELPRIDNQEAEQLKQQQAQQVVVLPTTEEQPAAAAPTPTASTTPVTQIPVTVVETAAATAAAAAATPPTPAVAPVPQTTPPQQAQPQPQPAAPPVRPATTVPRGETLTRDQINERVRQLEALAQQQRNTPPSR